MVAKKLSSLDPLGYYLHESCLLLSVVQNWLWSQNHLEVLAALFCRGLCSGIGPGPMTPSLQPLQTKSQGTGPYCWVKSCRLRAWRFSGEGRSPYAKLTHLTAFPKVCPNHLPPSSQPKMPLISSYCMPNAATAQLNFVTSRVRVKEVILFLSLG